MNNNIKKTVLRFTILGFLVAALMIFGLFRLEAPIIKGEHQHFNYKNDLSLDVYMPTKVKYEKAPVLFFIHGGAWIIGSRLSINNTRFHTSVNELRDKGYAVIAPDYTLAEQGNSPFPACIEDVKDAIAWTYANGDSIGLNMNKVGILGESAGAHIAMMVAFDEEYITQYPFDYLVDVYGPTSLYQLYLDQIPLIEEIQMSVAIMPDCISDKFDLPSYLFGYQPEKDTLKARIFADTFSPIRHVESHINFPSLIIHGEEDKIVPIDQSNRLMDTLSAYNLPFEFHSIKNTDHAFRGISKSDKMDVQQWIIDFVLENS